MTASTEPRDPFYRREVAPTPERSETYRSPESLTPDEAAFDVVIEGKPVNVMKVRLVGKSYMVRPPKTALALKLAVRAKQAEDRPELMAEAVDEWIGKAFNADDADDIRYRMHEAADDPLDLDHVMSLMEKLIERATGGNPTS